MGNADSNPTKNVDKRTTRRMYRDCYRGAIMDYRRTRAIDLEALEPASSRLAEEDGDFSAEPLSGSTLSNSLPNASSRKRRGKVQVYVRKRPIFSHERKQLEFDVITCIGKQQITVHDARVQADMRTRSMCHSEFKFDRVFNEKTTNDSVYKEAVQPLVHFAAKDFGLATVMMYGQTGSGKTYTMTSMYHKVAHDLFNHIDSSPLSYNVSVSFIEVAGDKVIDLFNQFESTSLLTGCDGSVHAFPVTEPSVDSAEDLIAFIDYAIALRSTDATGVHNASSRSHAILKMYIGCKGGKRLHSNYTTNQEGVITMVDLAGTEHKIDSMYHASRKLRRESSQINASLMALKSCIRAKAAGKNVGFNYRKSKLTMALKQSFYLPSALTTVIATISPSSKDTEHSRNTLRHACLMRSEDVSPSTAHSSSSATMEISKRATQQPNESHSYTVNLGSINVTKEARKLRGSSSEAKTKIFSNGNRRDGRYEGEQQEMTEKQLLRLKHEALKRASQGMTSKQKAILVDCRKKEHGRHPRQKARLQRPPEEEFPDAKESRSKAISTSSSSRLPPRSQSGEHRERDLQREDREAMHRERARRERRFKEQQEALKRSHITTSMDAKKTRSVLKEDRNVVNEKTKPVVKTKVRRKPSNKASAKAKPNSKAKQQTKLDTIESLQDALRQPNLSNAAKHGLRKRLAKLRAIAVRKERKAEQVLREAEEKAAAAMREREKQRKLREENEQKHNSNTTSHNYEHSDHQRGGQRQYYHDNNSRYQHEHSDHQRRQQQYYQNNNSNYQHEQPQRYNNYQQSNNYNDYRNSRYDHGNHYQESFETENKTRYQSTGASDHRGYERRHSYQNDQQQIRVRLRMKPQTTKPPRVTENLGFAVDNSHTSQYKNEGRRNKSTGSGSAPFATADSWYKERY
eukprot:g2524.t1